MKKIHGTPLAAKKGNRIEILQFYNDNIRFSRTKASIKSIMK